MACFNFFRSLFTIFRCIFAIITYCLDLITDITLGVRYLTDYWGLGLGVEWAAATWSITFLPGVINSVINIAFLCTINPGIDIPKWTVFLGYLSCFLCLGPPWHNLITIVKICEGDIFAAEDAEKLGSLQRGIQVVLQSLPQIFCQIYIISTINTMTQMIGITILASLISFLNGSFLVVRSLNRKFHFGISDLTIASIATLWIALLLISGVPPIAMLSALETFGPAFSALLIIILVYLLVLPLVFHTKTVFWKIISALCQLVYSSTMAVISFLWYFNTKEIVHRPDSCELEITYVTPTDVMTTDVTTDLPSTNASLTTVTFNITDITTTVTPMNLSEITTQYITSNTTDAGITDIISTTWNGLLSTMETNDTVAVELNKTRVIRSLESNPPPLLDLDRIHCLSDWSLVIIVVVVAANAFLFFFHLLVILAIRLRQQVAFQPVSTKETPELKATTET